MSRRMLVLASMAATGALALAGCGGAAGAGAGKRDGRLSVVASFYPLQWAAQRVAGNRASVTSLTKPGVEPHDLELLPHDVADIADADLVVYLQGFQPAVDQAVGQEAEGSSFDVSRAADLDLDYNPIEDGRRATSGMRDPHFWLDPTRLAAVVRAVARQLAHRDPEGAAAYRVNAGAAESELARLDRDFATGLAHCASHDLVTSHNAFGYLARRYGLMQIGITGLTPEDEPAPSDLGAVARFVRDHDVRTIYHETLVSPSTARTVAKETGADTAVLDPIEGLSDASRGNDYLAVMRSDLANLRKGQVCT